MARNSGGFGGFRAKACGWVAIPLIGLGVASCGKVRGWANQAQTTAKEAVAKVRGTKAPEKPAPVPPNPALQGLVDQTAEGAIFRADTPFPAQVRVRETRLLVFKSARALQQSAFGKQGVSLTGTMRQTTVYERNGGQLSLTLESAGFDAPVEPKPQTPAPAAPPTAPKPPAPGVKPAAGGGPAPALSFEPRGAKLAGSKLSFSQHGSTWKPTHNTDFMLANLGREVASALPDLVADAGVLPRPFWFGKRRLKPGDTIPLSGAAMALLFNRQTTGKVDLKLESFEACDGHPCGVFSVTGAYHEKSTSADGSKVDSEVTLNSGKVWLSLVHPILIREELDTIQTRTTDASGMTLLIQGNVAVSITREWR